jgi:hypothetical protein
VRIAGVAAAGSRVFAAVAAANGVVLAALHTPNHSAAYATNPASAPSAAAAAAADTSEFLSGMEIRRYQQQQLQQYRCPGHLYTCSCSLAEAHHPCWSDHNILRQSES